MSIYKGKEIRKRGALYKIDLNVLDYKINYPYNFNETKFKSINEICKRYISNLLSIQVAMDFLNNIEEVDKSIDFFDVLLDVYVVRDSLFKIEKRAFYGELNKEECFILTSQCECLAVLAWVLGLKDNIEPANVYSNINELLGFVAKCASFDSFVNTCNLRNLDDILKTYNLYYVYHHICAYEDCDGSSNFNQLNIGIVIERMRAFEWLFSGVNDWNDLSLYT